MKRPNINNKKTQQEFKQMLLLVDWDSVTKLQDVSAAYNQFSEIFSGFYE